MTFRLGLTGSIGMGKSTTAAMFRELGVPVWDADDTVHRLYAKGGTAVAPVAAILSEAIRDGAVDRDVLRAAMKTDPELLGRLERVVHPLAAADRAQFCRDHGQAPLVVLDIPLLFETGGQAGVDAVLVVTTDPETQRARVMARPGMTEALFDQIVARQVPDGEKRARADHVIETKTLEQTRASVADLVKRLSGGGDGDA